MYPLLSAKMPPKPVSVPEVTWPKAVKIVQVNVVKSNRTKTVCVSVAVSAASEYYTGKYISKVRHNKGIVILGLRELAHSRSWVSTPNHRRDSRSALLSRH